MSTVKKQYLCGYYCQSCGAFNCEVGEVEAMAKTQADAYKLVQQLFQNIKNTVNQRKKYRMPGIKGTCQKCGTKQVWSGHERKTSVVEKVLFAMTLVTMVIGVLGIFIYQSKLPLFLSCVLTLALIGILLMTMHMFDKAYWESVCKQVDEQLACIVHWNPYPFVMAPDDRADPNDERAVKLVQRMESLNSHRNSSLSNAQSEAAHEMKLQKISPQLKIPEFYPFTQWHAYGSPLFGIQVNEPGVEFVDKQTGRRTTIINENRVIQNFPGIENEEEIQEMLGEGSLTPYNLFGVDFSKMEDGRYQMIWEIQPDGQLFWQDEDGFGGTSDSEIKLSAVIDQQGRFVTPFTLYSVNGIKK